MGEGPTDRWAMYEAWNNALAQVIFGSESEGLPVYLDLEPEVLEAAGTAAGVSGDFRESLLNAVRSTVSPSLMTRRCVETRSAIPAGGSGTEVGSTWDHA